MFYLPISYIFSIQVMRYFNKNRTESIKWLTLINYIIVDWFKKNNINFCYKVKIEWYNIWPILKFCSIKICAKVITLSTYVTYVFISFLKAFQNRHLYLVCIKYFWKTANYEKSLRYRMICSMDRTSFCGDISIYFKSFY